LGNPKVIKIVEIGYFFDRIVIFKYEVDVFGTHRSYYASIKERSNVTAFIIIIILDSGTHFPRTAKKLRYTIQKRYKNQAGMNLTSPPPYYYYYYFKPTSTKPQAGKLG